MDNKNTERVKAELGESPELVRPSSMDLNDLQGSRISRTSTQGKAFLVDAVVCRAAAKLTMDMTTIPPSVRVDRWSSSRQAHQQAPSLHQPSPTSPLDEETGAQTVQQATQQGQPDPSAYGNRRYPTPCHSNNNGSCLSMKVEPGLKKPWRKLAPTWASATAEGDAKRSRK